MNIVKFYREIDDVDYLVIGLNIIFVCNYHVNILTIVFIKFT